MAATSTVAKLYDWVSSQRNQTIITAIVVAVPTAYWFQSVIADGDQAGNFLLLVTLAVGVPSAYDEYWPNYTKNWQAVLWVVLACTVVTFQFTGLYLLGTSVLALSQWVASVGAFLVTDLGDLAVLALWRDGS